MTTSDAVCNFFPDEEFFFYSKRILLRVEFINKKDRSLCSFGRKQSVRALMTHETMRNSDRQCNTKESP